MFAEGLKNGGHQGAAGGLGIDGWRPWAMQVNAALGDKPVDKLEYSLRQEMDQVVSVGARITGAMIK
jgi:hypothetical protein